MREAGPGRGRGAAGRGAPRWSRASAPPNWTPSPSGSSATAGAVPSFMGYHGFPADDLHLGQRAGRARHPAAGQRVLAAGDLISIDCGAIVGGWHGDAAVTVGVGPVSPAQLPACWTPASRPCGRAWPARWPAAGSSDISAAVEAAARARRPVRDRGGLRRARHRHARCTWTRRCRTTAGRAAGRCSTEGMALAVEPMLVLGDQETRRAGRRLDRGDRRTAAWAAHFEHTVAITADGPWVLTAADGGASGLAAARAGRAAAQAASASSSASAREHARAAAGATGNSGGS